MNSKRVGFCIYCGEKSKNLSKEHIIPKAFGGNRTLLEASCESCSKITSQIESSLFRITGASKPGRLSNLRAIMGMPSYRKSTKNAKLKQYVVNDKTGEAQEIFVSPEDFVDTIVLPILKEPGIITGNIDPQGISYEEVQTYHSNFNKVKPGFRYGVRFGSTVDNDFPRFLAKVAYGHMIFEHGYMSVEGSPLVKCILNNDKAIGMWVGCDPKNTLNKDGHAFWAVQTGNYKGRAGVKIKLLPEFPNETPEYIVIIK